VIVNWVSSRPVKATNAGDARSDQPTLPSAPVESLKVAKTSFAVR
jgi:hypothetical protein